MTLQKISNSNLVTRAKNISMEERRIVAAFLEVLREIEVRNVFLDLGFSSLYEFVVKYLGYSEGAATRRISAMRLLKKVPSLKPKIMSGELSISTASKIESFCKKENLDQKARERLAYELCGKSLREVEYTFAKWMPERPRYEKLTAIGEDHFQLSVSLSKAQADKLEKLRSLSSHKNPQLTYAGLLEVLLDLGLKKFDRTMEANAPNLAVAPSEKEYQNPRYIPEKIRAMVWQRSLGKCEFIDKESRRRCDSRNFLEVDHIKPIAWGGKSELRNLRLLCRAHNQWEAAKCGLKH